MKLIHITNTPWLLNHYHHFLEIFHHIVKGINSRRDLDTRRRILSDYDTHLILLITLSYLKNNRHWIFSTHQEIITTLTDDGCGIHVWILERRTLFDKLPTDDMWQCQFIRVFNPRGYLGKMWCTIRHPEEKGDNIRHHDGLFYWKNLSIYVVQSNPRTPLLLLSVWNASCLYRSSYRTGFRCIFQNQNPPEPCRDILFQ